MVTPEATARLRFRAMRDDDVARIAQLAIAPGATPEQWVAWTQRNYATYGFGLWVLETHDGGFVGDCGLTMQEVAEESLVEIGWHVRSDLQRRGYASEAAASVLDLARGAGMKRLVAIIRPENVASQATARRIGFHLDREVDKGGRALVFSNDLFAPDSGGGECP